MKVKNLKEFYNIFSSKKDDFDILISDLNFEMYSLKNITDLAEIFDFNAKIEILNEIPVMKFSKLKEQYKFDHEDRERYGKDSLYSNISKIYEPYYYDGLYQLFVNNCKLYNILDIGINSGDEFTILKDILGNKVESITGIDYSQSALDITKMKHPESLLINHDLRDYKSLKLEKKFNLLYSVGTLQSTTYDGKEFFRYAFQNWLTDDADIILGFPNCRYIDGVQKYGARVKNNNYYDLGLLFKDISFYKQYLNQHKKRVRIFGKYYIFVVGTSFIMKEES
ncbi:MAG: methyltransferase [Candidatus Delongbacteria bacterium]|nr:methyltransferase [Candidatus Delongbacteria bacterium]MBN2834896.1 methyltransferase [Candidatus Delongbacteria bacterium]